MGSFLRFLGFNLPLGITVDPVGSDIKNPPYDRQPGMGRCHLCKRERVVTYVKYDGARTCRDCIEMTFRARQVRWSRNQRKPLDSPKETVVEKPMDDFSARHQQWNRWFR